MSVRGGGGMVTGVANLVRKLWSSVVLGLAGCIAVASGAPAEPMDKDRPWPELRQETFEAVWTTVNTAYFDPTFGGVDWQGVRTRYAKKLEAVTDVEELRDLLSEMIAELGKSHLSILPREAAVFKPSERSRRGTSGVEVGWFEGRVVVTAVKADSTGAKAGLKVGAEIRRVGDLSIDELAAQLRAAGQDEARIGQALAGLVTSRLGSAVGTEVPLDGVAPDGADWKASVTSAEQDGEWSEPIGNYPSVPLGCEAKRGEDGIGYLRFNVFAPGLMKEIRALLKGLKKEDGLVIDLRGNPGGITAMAPAITGWLVDRETTLGQMKLRQGQMNFVAYPQANAFLGPVAVLVDGDSASTSEIFAAGLQGVKRARIFGERTAGAALPSSFRTLPTGDLLQYAIADLKTPLGATLEGKGVTPDETVERTKEDVTKGYDPVLEAARDWIDARRQEVRRR